MWPWEHVAVGYLLYSLGRRALGADPPSDGAAVAVAVAALLPDLIDKPLSWGLRLFPSGYAVGHSVLLAVPVGLASVVLADRFGRRWLGVAVLVGYWSHLVADVLAPLRRSSAPLPSRVLWPLVPQAPYDRRLGIRRGLVYLGEFVSSISSWEAALAYLLVPLPAVVVWVVDGLPGLRWLLVPVAARARDLADRFGADR